MDEIERIRRALSEQGPKRPGRRVPKALRRQAVAAMRQLRSAGQSLATISKRLDVSTESLRRWRQEEEGAELVPVEIRASTRPLSMVAPGPGMMLVAPNGYRIEGLDVAEAAELLRRLS